MALTPRLRRIILVCAALSLFAASCSGQSSDAPASGKSAADSQTDASSSVPDANPASDDPAVLGTQERRATVAVLIPNHDQLLDTGLVPRQTVEQSADFWRAELAAFNAARPDRSPLTLNVVEWDPLTPESTQRACRDVLDLGATVVATTANFPEAGYRCFSDAGIVVLAAGPVTDLRLTRFQGLIFSIVASREHLARSAVGKLDDAGLLTGRIAVIGNDQEGDHQAASAAVDALASRGYDASLHLVPSSQGIVALRSDARQLRDTLAAANLDQIVFASNATVANELSSTLQALGRPVLFIDVDGVGTLRSAQRLGPLWVNTIVASPLRPTSAPARPFESECQHRFRSFLRGEYVERPLGDWSARVDTAPLSNRGAPVDAVDPAGDVGYHECTLFAVLANALDALDGEATAEAISDALEAGQDGPVALGEDGSFAPDRHWLTDGTSLLQLAAGDACSFTETCWVLFGAAS